MRALELFYSMLSADPDRACYGLRDVNFCNEQLAIDQLLVTDTLFKAADITKRRVYVEIVDSVRANGGTVHVFSSLHPSGAQLSLYTGIAAILRHPMPELDSLDDQPQVDTSLVTATASIVPIQDAAAVTSICRDGASEEVGDRDIFDMDDMDFSCLSL